MSLDSSGFILTGADLEEAGASTMPLQTNIEGVFAIGDVRSGFDQARRLRRWARARLSWGRCTGFSRLAGE